MVKEAAKPHHNQQNQGGSGKQQQQRPNKGGKEAEPAAPTTKKQIEERQQNLLQVRHIIITSLDSQCPTFSEGCARRSNWIISQIGVLVLLYSRVK